MYCGSHHQSLFSWLAVMRVPRRGPWILCSFKLHRTDSPLLQQLVRICWQAVFLFQTLTSFYWQWCAVQINSITWEAAGNQSTDTQYAIWNRCTALRPWSESPCPFRPAVAWALLALLVPRLVSNDGKTWLWLWRLWRPSWILEHLDIGVWPQTKDFPECLYLSRFLGIDCKR